MPNFQANYWIFAHKYSAIFEANPRKIEKGAKMIFRAFFIKLYVFLAFRGFRFLRFYEIVGAGDFKWIARGDSSRRDSVCRFADFRSPNDGLLSVDFGECPGERLAHAAD